MMVPLQVSINHIEINMLNHLGRVPVLSSVTAVMRAILGVSQIFFGSLTYGWASFFDNKDSKFYASHHFVHGLLNVARSIIEAIPFINLTLLAYDIDPNNSSSLDFLNEKRDFKYQEYPTPTAPEEQTQECPDPSAPTDEDLQKGQSGSMVAHNNQKET
jgi:hypothetical protein